MDACHIAIQKPHFKNPITYLNRNNVSSVILTWFCVGQRWFCHISVGHLGSWYDARAFCLTVVAHALEEEPRSLVPEGMHIIGEFSYTLLPQLLKPYQDNGQLAARQKHVKKKFCN